MLNSKDFGVPQARKRVYIIGFLRGKYSSEILSFTEANGADLIQVIPGREGKRVYDANGVASTITSTAGGFAGRTNLYQIDAELPIRVKTKKGYQMAHPGDSIDIAYASLNSRRGRVGDKIAHTLTTSSTQALFFIDMNADPKVTDVARCITTRQDAGVSHHKGEHSAVLVVDEDEDDKLFTIEVKDKDGVIHHGYVRKLMPIECWRLQGFTDEQFHKAESTGLSDGRLYMMAGNSVTVPVISALGEVIKRVHNKSEVTSTNDPSSIEQ